MQVLSAEYEEK